MQVDAATRWLPIAIFVVALAMGACQGASDTPSAIPSTMAGSERDLEAVAIATLQREGDERHALAWEGEAVVGQGLGADAGPAPQRIAFDASGLRIGELDAPRLVLELAAITRGSTKATTALAASPRIHGHEVRYDRGPLIEWYLNGPLGIEHGFDLDAKPLAEVEGALVIELKVGGSLRPEQRGDEVVLVEDERVVFRYGKLFVADATGAAVPAELAADGDGIRIVIDDREAQYPLAVDPLMWVERQILTVPQGPPFGLFGLAVSVDGDTAVVTAGNAGEVGAAFVFVRMGTTWTFQQKVEDPGATDFDDYGFAAAVSGDTLAVSAPNGPTTHGRVYIYVRTGTTWGLQQILDDPTPTSNNFGELIDLDGDTLVASARFTDVGSSVDQGAVHVYRRSGTTWALEQALTASDGSEGEGFGTRVALDGNTLAVGMYNDVINGQDYQGSVYVFERVGSVWTETQKLVAGDGDADDSFGYGLALQGNTLAVGAPYDDLSGFMEPGSAYVFTRVGSTWLGQQKLTRPNGMHNDRFGAELAVDGNLLLVGAPGRVISGANQGEIHVYEYQLNYWYLDQTVVASDGNPWDFFGDNISLSGRAALVGVGFLFPAGKAYALDLEGTLGDPCTAAFQCDTGHCVDGVCCNEGCVGGATDDCWACSIAAGASSDGTCKHVTNGSSCDDGDACTGTDVCMGGICGGVDICGAGGAAGTGGAGGDGGSGGAGGTSSGGGVSPTGGAGGDMSSPDGESGCGCRHNPGRGTSPVSITLLLGLLVALRWRRRPIPSPANARVGFKGDTGAYLVPNQRSRRCRQRVGGDVP
ncbi:MAG: hypothetical protein KC731_23485 [Myxococcales bacterium]|nr:hypothetical protein [Myxococcales bacterium]